MEDSTAQYFKKEKLPHGGVLVGLPQVGHSEEDIFEQ